MIHRAVIFDLGGVVLGSPLHAIAEFEREQGIDTVWIRFISVMIREDRSIDIVQTDLFNLSDSEEIFHFDFGGLMKLRLTLKHLDQACKVLLHRVEFFEGA